MADIPAGLLANIKTSLAAPSDQWRAQMVFPSATQLSVSLVSGALYQPGTHAPLTLTWVATLDESGVFVSGFVHMANGAWESDDAALHAQVAALGETFLAGLAASLTEALA